MSSVPVTQDELIQILEDLGAGDIDVTEAARRAEILDTEPGRYRCGTCRFFRRGDEKPCRYPGQPPREESPHSVRCQRYEYRDPRDDALPIGAVVARTNSSKMFK